MTGTLLAIGLLWSEIFPVFTILKSVTLIGNLTVLELAQAVLIVVVTTVATLNLPGLIKLVVLRTTKMTAGSRKALTTLCQYVLIAIGAALVFHVLDLGWGQFGWIATALSVGLGFGLQEVVANFVCGIILLFERPIRVGDFVTVEGVIGRVTKIQLRATTIVNFDHQEFVVPNKNFVTGTLLNWTLNDSTVRIVVTVGVAYSTDTDRAQEVLLDIASRHPDVLDDPKPEATFEEFADSSLTLRLKVHVPNVEKRIPVLSELHSSIKKNFASEGIEIAFPQRDLHIRTPGVIDVAK
jgi:potassium efflux system protein